MARARWHAMLDDSMVDGFVRRASVLDDSGMMVDELVRRASVLDDSGTMVDELVRRASMALCSVILVENPAHRHDAEGTIT